MAILKGVAIVALSMFLGLVLCGSLIAFAGVHPYVGAGIWLAILPVSIFGAVKACGKKKGGGE